MAAARTVFATSFFVIFMVVMGTAVMAADGPAPPPTENLSVRELPSVALAFFAVVAFVFSMAY